MLTLVLFLIYEFAGGLPRKIEAKKAKYLSPQILSQCKIFASLSVVLSRAADEK